jgi:phage tail sheath gpL-like
MPISFETIPTNLRTPGAYTEISNIGAVRGPALKTYRALLIGQRLSTGSIAAGVPKQLSSAAQARTFFGRASVLERMAIKWFANNPATEVWAIALDDNGAGVQATGTITITGTATASGTLNIYIAGQRVQVAVVSGDVQNTIATSINTAIGLALDLPVTTGVSTNVVTLTARHKGELGNVDLRVNYDATEATPAGVTVTLSGTVLTAGATNPVITTAVTAMADVQYDVIAHPYIDTSNLALMKTELDARWGPLEMIEGHAVTAMIGTFSALTAFGAARNDAHLTIVGVKLSPTPTYEQAAAFAGIVAYYGQIDPARPWNGLTVSGVLAPAVLDRFTQSERNLLLFDGIATQRTASDGTVQVDRIITTYQTNSAGADDISYLDANTVLTLAYLRYSLRTRFLTAYPRHKLASDGNRFAPGQAILTPKGAKGEVVGLFRQWEELGLVEDAAQFKRDLIAEVNASDPTRLDLRISPNIVNGLHIMATQIAFVL